MNAKLSYAIRFANTCNRYKVEPLKLGEFVKLIVKAYRAGERECNEPDYFTTANKARTDVETMAKTFGWKIQWSGLYPTILSRKGEDIRIPTE